VAVDYIAKPGMPALIEKNYSFVAKMPH